MWHKKSGTVRNLIIRERCSCQVSKKSGEMVMMTCEKCNRRRHKMGKLLIRESKDLRALPEMLAGTFFVIF